MKELIPIENKDGKQTVNARELHGFLESKQKFSDWIKARIKDYDFVEDQDFVTNHKIMARAKLKEYHISIDMAKELAMVERSDKGKEARKYFIECEKELMKQPLERKLPTNFKEALIALVEAEEFKESQQKMIEAQAPFVKASNHLMGSRGTISMAQMAKLLCKEGIDMGRNRLIRLLKENKILMSDNTPYQRYMNCKFFEVKEEVITRTEGSMVVISTRVTGKGQLAILKKVKEIMGVE